jgi:hypothetical protein
MKVKNIPNTSNKTCNCKSWYEHWKKSSKYDKLICSNVNCKNTEPVGAHVKKYNSTDLKHYIVPLCKECNNPNNITIMDIGKTHLARAIKLPTCSQ